MNKENGTITVTLDRADAYAVALGPLDYVCKAADDEVPDGGSPMRVRQALMKALDESK